MAKERKSFVGPVLTVRFFDGLAATNRLPLEHVLRVLQEVKAAIEEAAELSRFESGLSPEETEVGLDLLAGFRKGSVVANLAFTRNADLGVAAAEQFVTTIANLRPKAGRRKPTSAFEFRPKVVSRLTNIAMVQELTKTKLDVRLTINRKRHSAVFDEIAAAKARSLKAPNLVVENTTVFGRIRELRDQSDSHDETGKFVAVIIADNGDRWSAVFKPEHSEQAAILFRRRIAVTGTAHYYPATRSKIVVRSFEPDDERDYLSAFDELFGSEAENLRGDLQDLIDQVKGEARP